MARKKKVDDKIKDIQKKHAKYLKDNGFSKKKTATKKSVAKKSVAKKTVVKKPEPVQPEKKTQTQVQREMNLEGIKVIKAAMIENPDFSIGLLARELKWPFQKVRHYCIQIARKADKGLVRLERGKWTCE